MSGAEKSVNHRHRSAAIGVYLLRQQVSTSLLGVVPEDFCRDAPAVAVGRTESLACGRGLSSTAIIEKGGQAKPSAAPSGGGGSSNAGCQLNSCHSTSPRSPRLPQQQQKQQQSSPKSKRQRGAPTAITSVGDEDGTEERSREERSRRRLAAFLEGQVALSEAPAPVPATAVGQGVDSSIKSPRPPGSGAIGGDDLGGGGSGGLGDGTR